VSSLARSYHHGDLRHALLAEASRQARSGGPAAISLREVTRAVGVSPNAAYRHFADREALVRAAAAEAQSALALAISQRVAATAVDLAPAPAAIERLRRVGLAYIDFARAEPGWFELAFLTQDPDPTAGIVTLDAEVVPPFELLLRTLDEMVAAGALAPARRPLAEWACWSSVHGFADIASRGPVRHQPGEVIDALAASVVESAIAGVRGTSEPPR
jgi:AcrR family transcriptional regulator